MDKNCLLPPCAYQGGKQRVAFEIVDYIIANDPIFPSPNGTKIYDLCCGSGAVTIEFLNRGVDPSNIVMCDKSSWGKFWEAIGSGTFSIEKFNWYCRQVPKDKSLIQGFLQELSKTSANEEEEYKYILLQAGSFGGKQIWKDGDKWLNTSFRSYWQPTETSKRRSPVNPMQPTLETLQKRVELIAKHCVGIQVVHDDVFTTLDIIKNDNAIHRVVYIDPPYSNTTGYAFQFDLNQFLSDLFDSTLSPIYVSESKPLSDECQRLRFNGAKGGISGLKQHKNEEWLSVFR